MKEMFDLKKNYEISRKLAAQGMVLLKNEEKTLPIPKNERIGIIGKECLNLIKGGGGSGNVKCEYVKSFADGLKEKEKEGKLVFEESSLHIAENTEEYDVCTLNRIAAVTDKVILTLQSLGTEGEDRKPEDFDPTKEKLELLQKIQESEIESVILVLNFANIVNLSFLEGFEKIKAILFASMPGMECGSAIMDVLCGDVNPSGKLVDTIAKEYRDYPSAEWFDYDPRKTEYKEGIYVGYRYFETFAKEKVLYPFGYGLSYTEFKYGNYSYEEESGKIKICVDVTNIGKYPGREVVQAYCASPQGKLPKPAVELKGYGKTKELKPGEMERITIYFSVKDMASYDTDGVTGYEAAWVLEKGDYRIYVGKSVRERYLCGAYHVGQTRVAKQLRNRFAGEKYILQPKRFLDEIYENKQKVTLYDVKEGKAKLEELIEQMSPEELVGLSLGQPIAFPMGTSGIGNLKKYGIPNPQTADGPVGVRRSVNTTCFPCSTLIACSWDHELQYAMGAAMGYEGYSTGIDILLGPAMNIHRDPLAGRNYEYFSEDPLISGKTAAAIVNGLQSEGLCATLKHFAVNNCEYYRNINNSIVDERTIREIYLKGFEIAVKESNPAFIMTSYNLLNGEHTSANAQLMRGILRDEWEYEGATMTDWRNGVSLVDEVLAGNNIKMPFGYPDEGEKVLEAYRDGRIPLWVLRENAFYVVGSILKTRSFLQQDFGIIHKQEGLEMEIPVMEVNGLASSRINHAAREDGTEYLWQLNREQRNQRSFVYYVLDMQKEGNYLVTAEIKTNCPETQIWFYDENEKRLGTAYCTAAVEEEQWYTVEANIQLHEGENLLKLVFANEPYKDYEYFNPGPEIPNAWPELAKEDVAFAKLKLSYIEK